MSTVEEIKKEFICSDCGRWVGRCKAGHLNQIACSPTKDCYEFTPKT